jgi:hypothetical protein
VSQSLEVPPLDSMRACRVLAEHGVRYVLIGGVALNMAGVTMVTVDVDVCYEATQANTRALARALRALEAVPVDADNRPLPAPIDPRAFQLHDTFLFVTLAGRVDCLRVPDGTAGYDDLVRTAVELDLGGFATWIPSIEDMVRMKTATGRPKDRLALEQLGTLREILDDDAPIPFNPSDLPEANRP